MKKLTLQLLFYIQFISLTSGASPDPVFGENGMVVSTSKQASEAGISILKKGGNAIDAAWATSVLIVKGYVRRCLQTNRRAGRERYFHHQKQH